MTSNHNAKIGKLQAKIALEKLQRVPSNRNAWLHQENIESKDDTKDTVKCASEKGRLDTEVMCVVPVCVIHRNSRKMVMLDNCSQGSFIKDEIIEDLGISGRKLKLSLKTLTGEKSEDTEAVDGLIISAVYSK